MNVCKKLQLDIKHEKIHTGEKCYSYNKNMKPLSNEKDHQKLQSFLKSFECNEFGKVLHDTLSVLQERNLIRMMNLGKIVIKQLYLTT